MAEKNRPLHHIISDDGMLIISIWSDDSAANREERLPYRVQMQKVKVHGGYTQYIPAEYLAQLASLLQQAHDWMEQNSSGCKHATGDSLFYEPQPTSVNKLEDRLENYLNTLLADAKVKLMRQMADYLISDNGEQ